MLAGWDVVLLSSFRNDFTIMNLMKIGPDGVQIFSEIT